MRFEISVKGYEYVSEDGTIRLRRYETFKKVGFGYVPTFYWNVYGIEDNKIYGFETLNGAKKFVRERLGK